MRIRIHVIKVYEVETDGGDTTDSTDYAEVVHPDDFEVI